MASVGSDLENVLLTEPEVWEHGVPNELFARMRGECPVHRPRASQNFPRRPAFGR
jgi:hypothetical protein